MSNKRVTPYKEPQIYRRSIGSARLIPQEKLNRQRYVTGDFWLGRTLSGNAFGWNEELNLLTCAGPGGGKGVSSVVPNLLEYPGSTVVIDPKGELATLTAAYRRDVLGQKVIVLDPANTAGVPDELRGTYNPLDELRANDPGVTRAAQTITSGMVVKNPKSTDPFWDDNAHDYIQSCILYMVKNYPPEQRTLMRLRETVALGDENLFAAWLAQKREADPDYQESPDDEFELFQRALFDTKDFGGIVRETAAKIRRMGEKARGSVLSTASTHLEFLKTPELWEVLSSNPDPAKTFKLSELRRQDKHLTVYLCLPIDMIPYQGRWFRLILSRMIQYIERTAFDKRTDYPVMMMIDEFYNLGPMPSIVNTLTYTRSAGLRLWLILQDLNQLKEHYPESWETILGACGVKQFFGVNDSFTAKYVSELIGEEEIDVPSISMTKTFSDTESVNGSTTETQSVTDTTGTNRSSTSTINGSDTYATTTNTSIANGTGTNSSHNSNAGTSGGINSGRSGGTNTGSHDGSNTGKSAGKSYNGDDSNHATRNSGDSSGTNIGRSRGTQSGWSNGTNAGWSASQGKSNGTSTNTTVTTGTANTHSQTAGWSLSTTTGTSESRAVGHSTAMTKGWGTAATSGENYTLSVGKQKRRVFTTDEVMLSFTKSNLVQLVHIRDQGGFLLRRTPYYADPYLAKVLANSDLPSASASED